MNLRSIDLNLLVALDALLKERHVTRAADRIGMSQPAMSNALSRLRHIFKDELLVRGASGMQPTPRALELIEPMQQVIRQIERVLELDPEFDPAQSPRSFTVRLSDLLQLLLLPTLLETLSRDAPAIAFDVVHLPPARTVEALEKDEIDLAVSMGLEHPGSIRSQVLFSDRMVCLMRRSHPLASQRLTEKRFLSCRHLKISMAPTDMRFTDALLARDGLKRDVALNVPHWLVVPHVLVRTDFLSVMPGRFAKAIAGTDLVARDLPFAPEPFDWTLYWHRRHEGNVANLWLRKRLTEVASTLR